MTYNLARYDAIMRAPGPPKSATPYQIKQEAKRRGVWFAVLQPALTADADVYEDFLVAESIALSDPQIDAFADMVRGEEDLGAYKDSFFREAVARTHD